MESKHDRNRGQPRVATQHAGEPRYLKPQAIEPRLIDKALVSPVGKGLLKHHHGISTP
jgi:hypothetical protein